MNSHFWFLTAVVNIFLRRFLSYQKGVMCSNSPKLLSMGEALAVLTSLGEKDSGGGNKFENNCEDYNWESPLLKKK